MGGRELPLGKIEEAWRRYLSYLDRSPYSISRLARSLSPRNPIPKASSVRIEKLSYRLWNFQEKVLKSIDGDTLIVGLPTGLGKTYIAGAALQRMSLERPIRVLFLVPSIPLGVQQTLFAREKLNVEAYFVSGELPRERRVKLRVWNAGFVVCTPQTFFNDLLAGYRNLLLEARSKPDPIRFLRESGLRSFPYDVVVADECQRYIGLTDGYSILLAAKASSARILALTATPLFHDLKRYRELKRVFDRVQMFTVEDSEVREALPRRILKMVEVDLPVKVKILYEALSKISENLRSEVERLYGLDHDYINCREHKECKKLKAFRVLTVRLVEDGVGSVVAYQTWRLPEVKVRVEGFNVSAYRLFLEALREGINHKLEVLTRILSGVRFEKAIVFVESVQAAKQIGVMLQDRFGLEDVAILVGRGLMDMARQTTALLQFKGGARILVATSVAEEGIDIPSADLEVWVDPPANPRKWIQRFGRILRQPGGKSEAVTYAIVSRGTHERLKLRSALRKAMRYYGFTQVVVEESLGEQKSLTGFSESKV